MGRASRGTVGERGATHHWRRRFQRRGGRIRTAPQLAVSGNYGLAADIRLRGDAGPAPSDVASSIKIRDSQNDIQKSCLEPNGAWKLKGLSQRTVAGPFQRASSVCHDLGAALIDAERLLEHVKGVRGSRAHTGAEKGTKLWERRKEIWMGLRE